MLLAELAQVSAALAATRGRRAKIDLLAGILSRLEPDERETGSAWLAGLLPGGKLGLGPAALQALRGLPAAAEPGLDLRELRARLESLPRLRGKGCGERRQAVLAEVFSQASAEEQDFLLRLLLGELRQGALEGVMAEAIAQAAGLPLTEVRRALMLGSLGEVAAVALGEGAAGLARFRLQLFQPLSPMLANPAEDAAQALAAHGGRAHFDWKIDGARAQIHKRQEEVRIYSRQGRDVSFSLPEIVSAVAALPARQLILDAEVIALQPSGRPRPFQDTMRRFGRRLDVEASRADLPLSLFCFDCLHAEGQDLINRPLSERLALLARHLPAALRVPSLLTEEPAAAEAFLAQALAAGHEGAMAKAPDSRYDAGGRGAAWLKLKQAHTLDLVVLAAEWGSGRRRGWLSNLHLGAREDGEFIMLGKTFKGLSDELLAWQTERLLALALPGEGGGMTVRVRPELVVEIAFNELQASPRYPGGLSLRFARVLRYRPDKLAAEADSMSTVRRLAGQEQKPAAP